MGKVKSSAHLLLVAPTTAADVCGLLSTAYKLYGVYTLQQVVCPVVQPVVHT